MLIEIPFVSHYCPHCNTLQVVDIQEADIELPYWTVCAGEQGCGEGYRIHSITAVAYCDPDGQALSVTADPRP